MLAIPIFRSRVAPVLNWSTRLLILPEDATSISLAEEVDLTEISDPFQRLRRLRDKGVTVLICGALSPDLRNYARQLGVSVICGVAGEIPDVFAAYCRKGLDQPIFRLPGCRRRRSCYRGSGSKRKENHEVQPAAPESLPKSRSDSGPSGNCICPQCGATIPHQRGTPCTRLTCSQCGCTMIRQ